MELTLQEEKFVLMKSTIRQSSLGANFLKNDNWIREIRHCIQIQTKSARRITWAIRKWRRILMEKFEELMNEPAEMVHFSDKQQHRFRRILENFNIKFS